MRFILQEHQRLYLCSLPLTQNRCPHANACLTCSHFRTSKQYLERHKSQREETQKVIENAKQHGWQRIVEMNTEVVNNLNSIISTLELSFSTLMGPLCHHLKGPPSHHLKGPGCQQLKGPPHLSNFG